MGGHAVRGSTYCRRRWDYCHLRLDVIAIGGATAARRVQTLAVERAIAVSFHVYTEVSVHLATTQPGTFDQDCPGRQPARPGTPPAHRGLNAADGRAIAPDTPGLAFDLDWSLFR